MPSPFQNPNGAQMAWIQFGGDVNNPKPGVLVIHGQNFNAGDAGDVAGETREIANAGPFFAASVWYELAPNADTPRGYIPGQPCHDLDGTDPGWRMNLEVNDIKNAVRAMRADRRCNGWVAVVGGSAGATHAITVALDTNPSPNGDWPHWFKDGHDDRPDCAVMLSAIYDFSDWTPPTGETQINPVFLHLGLNNYAQVPNPIDVSTAASLPLNPVNLVPGAIAHGFKPIYMINSYGDNPTAYHQLVGMVCLLRSASLSPITDYQYLTIPGDLHSFHYWGAWDHGPTDKTVGDDVIAFLKAHAGLP
jgi:acetyl esterase/lipase